MPDYLNLICGLPDGGQAWITQLQPTFEFRWDGSACLLSQISLERPCAVLWVGPAGQARATLAPGPVVNNIADPDLCGAALNAASAIARQIDWPWFNHPDRIRETTRDRVSEMLRDILGVCAPKVVRCKPEHIEDLQRAIAGSGIDYPVLVRAVGSQRGLTMVRIESADDARAFMACLAAGAELYIFPFVDFSSADGLFRKYRVAMIGGQPFLNSLVTGAHWNVHASSRIWNEAAIAEERDALDGFETGLGARLRPQLAEIHRRLGLDYFGLDFALTRAGEMLIFEANATMEFLGPSTLEPNIWARSGAAIKTALLALLDQPERWVGAAQPSEYLRVSPQGSSTARPSSPPLKYPGPTGTFPWPPGMSRM